MICNFISVWQHAKLPTRTSDRALAGRWFCVIGRPLLLPTRHGEGPSTSNGALRVLSFVSLWVCAPLYPCVCSFLFHGSSEPSLKCLCSLCWVWTTELFVHCTCRETFWKLRVDPGSPSFRVRSTPHEVRIGLLHQLIFIVVLTCAVCQLGDRPPMACTLIDWRCFCDCSRATVARQT